MIARIWHGWARGEQAEAYEQVVGEEVLPSIYRIDGFLGKPSELVANRWQPKLFAVLTNRFTAHALVRAHCITSAPPSS